MIESIITGLIAAIFVLMLYHYNELVKIRRSSEHLEALLQKIKIGE